MLKKIVFWLNNSRLFSLPMTLMSWAIIFVYSLRQHGNILNGVLALIGIAMAHLATNLFDDFVDYKVISANEDILKNTVKSKCAYIQDGSATLNDLLKVVCIYCSIAFVVGVILTLRCGLEIVWLAFIGGVITLSYAKLSSAGLSEIAVGTAFGPLLFEGVYFVMTGSFSMQVLVISLAVVTFTVGLLYTHTLLDYDGDMCAHKKTLCCRLGDKNKASILLLVLYGFGYFLCFVLAFYCIWYLLPVLTCPFAVILYRLMQLYNKDKSFIPEIKWWYYPLENWENITQEGTQSFYLRLFLSRNIMIWFSILMLVAVCLN